jgi:hypothetical protein
MLKRLTAVMLMGLAIFIWGCPKDDDEDKTPTPTPTADDASGSVSSDTSGVIETTLGARISVPVGAVPRTDQGNVGTIVFSVERNNDISVTPPTGETVVSDVYQFGPEGFTFARPVEVTVPVPEGEDPAEVSLWRKNPTTGQAEFFSSSYDPVARTISAQTYVLSPWFATGHGRDSTCSGCINVSNMSHSSWLMICVEQYTLLYPGQGPWWPESGSGPLFAPIGTIGWASQGNWYLPQGTFRLCLQRESETNPGRYEHIFMDNVQVHRPWHYTNPQCTNISNGSFTSPDTGRCACIPIATTSVGTGDIQVTLTWFYAEPGVDLDLWVMDPDSEWCYYGNDSTASGGVLDRDNWCLNYENGRPENIFWTSTPPAGEYIVAVDWYSTCGSEAVGSLSFNLRTVVQGTTRTYTQTIEENESMHEVARFTIGGGAVVFQPPRGDVSWAHLPRPTKL